MRAKAIVRTVDGYILLGYDPSLSMWSLPGGHAEAKEEPVDALLRELKEELNLTSFVSLEHLGTHPDASIFLVVCKDKSPDLSSANDPDLEFSEIKWFRHNELPDQLNPEADFYLHAYLNKVFPHQKTLRANFLKEVNCAIDVFSDGGYLGSLDDDTIYLTLPRLAQEQTKGKKIKYVRRLEKSMGAMHPQRKIAEEFLDVDLDYLTEIFGNPNRQQLDDLSHDFIKFLVDHPNNKFVSWKDAYKLFYEESKNVHDANKHVEKWVKPEKIAASISKWGKILSWIHASAEKAASSILDDPKKILNPELWVYEDGDFLPHLKSDLRDLIIRMAKENTQKFGMQLKKIHLYGGSAGYQYTSTSDIDCAVYAANISNYDIQAPKIKEVEEFYGAHPVHLFLKPEGSKYFEISEAVYDVIDKVWVTPPYIFPENFDPDEYFAPFIAHGEKRARIFDLKLGELSRLITSINKKSDLKDLTVSPEIVAKNIAEAKKEARSLIKDLAEEFEDLREARRFMHKQLEEKYLDNGKIKHADRMQQTEVIWKYLDRYGYLNKLAKIKKFRDENLK